MNKLNAFSLSSACAGGIISFFVGSVDLPLRLLLGIIVIDYITGLIAAASLGGLNSEIGFKGIMRKVIILLLVCVGHMLDMILGTSNMLRDGIVFFYFANEALSIIENACVLGVPVPQKIYKAIDILKAKGE